MSPWNRSRACAARRTSSPASSRTDATQSGAGTATYASSARANGLVYQGFSLLTANGKALARPELARIARRHRRTASQIVFRFALERGHGTFDRHHQRRPHAGRSRGSRLPPGCPGSRGNRAAGALMAQASRPSGQGSNDWHMRAGGWPALLCAISMCFCAIASWRELPCWFTLLGVVLDQKPCQGRCLIMTWEQRWHPLREEWVIVAAHRNNRPWVGGTVESQPRIDPARMRRTVRSVPATRGSVGHRTPITRVSSSLTTTCPASGPRPARPGASSRNLPQSARRGHCAGGLLHSAARHDAGRA